MKRKFILLPITLVSFTPMVGMVGCNNPNTPEEKTEFTIGTGKMTSATEGTFQFGWANGHSLTFGTDWEFTTSVGTVKSVTATGGDTRPQTVSITFDKEIIETDIADGKLTFTYSDLTTKKDNISATIENICITKYTPTPKPIIIDVNQCNYDWWRLTYLHSAFFSAELNQECTFILDLSKWEVKTFLTENCAGFEEKSGNPAPIDCYEVVDIIVDNKHLEKSTWQEYTEGTYCITDDPEYPILTNQTFTKNSTYIYKIKFLKEVIDIRFWFGEYT